jgi:hypothetical protein
MKGQHTILREVFLFAIGVAITSFIVLSFNNVKYSASELALEDQMLKVADTVAGSIVNIAETKQNATIRIILPEKLSDEIYRIKLSDDSVSVFLFTDPSINITKKIFNITKTYVIAGEVVSTGRFFEIVSENKNIRIRRAVI